jgi:hypothetical protein
LFIIICGTEIGVISIVRRLRSFAKSPMTINTVPPATRLKTIVVSVLSRFDQSSKDCHIGAGSSEVVAIRGALRGCGALTADNFFALRKAKNLNRPGRSTMGRPHRFADGRRPKGARALPSIWVAIFRVIAALASPFILAKVTFPGHCFTLRRWISVHDRVSKELYDDLLIDEVNHIDLSWVAILAADGTRRTVAH